MVKNKVHPELEEGEMFISNTGSEDYAKLGWTTKRMGTQAYSITGEPLKWIRPVFIQISEYLKKRKEHDK